MSTFRIVPQSDGVLVTTHCIYPSGGMVQCFVRGGVSTFYVSDQGRGVGEIEAAGAVLDNPDMRALQHIVKQYGLTISRGVVSAPPTDVANLSAAIVLVANASRDVATWLFEHLKIKPPRNFKQLLKQFLEMRFVDRVTSEETVIGHSNKPHKFEHAACPDCQKLSGGHRGGLRHCRRHRMPNLPEPK